MFKEFFWRTWSRPSTPTQKPLCSWCSAPVDVPGYKATWLEQRLARRIHNQRQRLKQLEKMKGWGSRSHERWMARALELGVENKALQARIAAFDRSNARGNADG